MAMPYLHSTETKLMLQVKKDLDRHEGFREYAYPDPLSRLGKKYKGKDYPWGFKPAREIMMTIPGVRDQDGSPWTMGYGFTNGVTPDSRISKQLAERKLEELILEYKDALITTLPWVKEATFVTQTVLINMAFNLGLKGLLGFRNTLRFIKDKNYEQAARNMKLSLWHKQVGDRALELEERMAIQTIAEPHRAEERL